MEPNTPQPGRIPPVQLKEKLPSATGSSKISNAASLGIQTAAKAMPRAEKEAIDVGVGLVATSGLAGVGVAPVIAGKIIESRIKSSNRKGIEELRRDLRYSGKGKVPQTKKRITGLGQALFIGFALLIDVLEFVLDCFAVGVIANRIIDIVGGVIFLFYALFKGLSMADNWAVFESIVATILGEFVPFLDAAPFFTIDAWFITHTIKRKDQARQAELDQEAQTILDEQNRINWLTEYEREQAESTQVETDSENPEKEMPPSEERPAQKREQNIPNQGRKAI